jgi:hypothetical protein
MNKRIFLALAFSVFFAGLISAQRNDAPRPMGPRERLLMSLDSLDRFYIGRLKPRDRYGAEQMLDRITNSVKRLGRNMEERERDLDNREQALRDKERDLQEREAAIREREQDRAWRHDRDKGDDRDYNRSNDDRRRQPEAMDDRDFQMLLASVEQAPFTQDKVKVIRTSAMNNYFFIDQVIKLTSKLPFDGDKLEVVETLYPKILDVDKNYLLYNCITFSDSKNKLEKFIREYQPDNR